MELGFTDPVENNRKLYENACKKFHVDPEKTLFSWQLKKVFNEYIDNGGFVGLMSFSTPYQIQSYAYISNSSFGENSGLMTLKIYWINCLSKYLIIF